MPTTPSTPTVGEPDLSQLAPPGGFDTGAVVAGVGDEIDPASLAVTTNVLTKAGAKKVITLVPAERPANSDWVYITTNPAYRCEAAIYEPKKLDTTQRVPAHLILPAVVAVVGVGRGVRIVDLVVYQDRQGNVGIWPISKPSGTGRENSWISSARDIAFNHAGQWVNVVSNQTKAAYDLNIPVDTLPEPPPIPLPMPKLLAIAFKDHVISSVDHPMMRDLRGIFE